MEDKELFDLWKKGDDLMKTGKISNKQIDNLLKPRITRFSVFMKSLLFTYMLLQTASIIILSYNIFGYRNNIVMQAVSSGLILLSGFFLFYGLDLFKSYKLINQKNTDIFSLLREKIDFFQHKFEWWNYIAAASLWIVTFAINTYVDNVDGVYRINKPFVYFGISLGMMVFIYATNKSAVTMMLKETRACLKDLESALEGKSDSFAKIKKRHQRIIIITIVICTIFFIIGLLVFLSRS